MVRKKVPEWLNSTMWSTPPPPSSNDDGLLHHSPATKISSMKEQSEPISVSSRLNSAPPPSSTASSVTSPSSKPRNGSSISGGSGEYGNSVGPSSEDFSRQACVVGRRTSMMGLLMSGLIVSETNLPTTAFALTPVFRVADDGKLYYQVEGNIKSYANNNELAVMPTDRVARLEWDRRYLAVLGVENNRLYSLRLQTPNERVFQEEEKDIRRVMDSFRVEKI